MAGSGWPGSMMSRTPVLPDRTVSRPIRRPSARCARSRLARNVVLPLSQGPAHRTRADAASSAVKKRARKGPFLNLRVDPNRTHLAVELDALLDRATAWQPGGKQPAEAGVVEERPTRDGAPNGLQGLRLWIDESGREATEGDSAEVARMSDKAQQAGCGRSARSSEREVSEPAATGASAHRGREGEVELAVAGEIRAQTL